MAAKAVAVEGDTQASASTSTAPSDQPAWSGSWTAGSISETSYSELTVKGVKVIYQAKCTFSFSGTDTSVTTSPPPVSTTSDITLSAQSTLLQKNGSGTLVQGDSASDSHGNRLSIQASGHLKTE